MCSPSKPRRAPVSSLPLMCSSGCSESGVLPEQIITDNGNPFCTARAIGGITELSKMWIKLGIQHTRIQPGRPQQNGSHERMHRTLKSEATRPAEKNRLAQQRRFDEFRHRFNRIRPHQSLGQERPASLVTPYRRPYPDRIPEPQYPSSFEVRRVRAHGVIKWRGDLVFVSEVLIGEPIGLARIDEDRWDLYFGTVRLAVWSDRHMRFEAPDNSECRTPSSILPLKGEEEHQGVKNVSVDL